MTSTRKCGDGSTPTGCGKTKVAAEIRNEETNTNTANVDRWSIRLNMNCLGNDPTRWFAGKKARYHTKTYRERTAAFACSIRAYLTDGSAHEDSKFLRQSVALDRL